jgi:hypothetical protein
MADPHLALLNVKAAKYSQPKERSPSCCGYFKNNEVDSCAGHFY